VAWAGWGEFGGWAVKVGSTGSPKDFKGVDQMLQKNGHVVPVERVSCRTVQKPSLWDSPGIIMTGTEQWQEQG
jgi:hypothetical protein